MDTRFAPHNRQWESAEAFWQEDPHLKQLQRQPLVYRSPLIDRLPRAQPGIYTVTGGRQTGKTTLLKQWMGELLHAKMAPTALLFLTGELIDDHSLDIKSKHAWILKGSLKNLFIVIPAKAGIQSNHTDGFRVKPGMTNYSRLP